MAASRSEPCTKHDPSAGRLVGWLKVSIRIVLSEKLSGDSMAECCHAAFARVNPLR